MAVEDGHKLNIPCLTTLDERAIREHIEQKRYFWLDLDNPPHARVQAAPIYPQEAKHTGLGGEVLVEFTVDERGTVSEQHVTRSTDRIESRTAPVTDSTPGPSSTPGAPVPPINLGAR